MCSICELAQLLKTHIFLTPVAAKPQKHVRRSSARGPPQIARDRGDTPV